MDSYDRAFAAGTALNIGFVLIELGYGFAAHSLALLADAVHNFSDVVGLVLAWWAHELGHKPSTPRFTFGFHRASILAALANAALLLGAVGMIVAQAIYRFMTPETVAAQTVGWVAGAGIVINTATALLFLRGRKTDLNIDGAFLHMAADAAVSLGVVVGAIAIAYTGFAWIDPFLSLIIAAVIFAGSWGLAHKALVLAMDGVPHGIDRAAVREHLTALPGVASVHDLHIWAMGTTDTALNAHLVRPGHGPDDAFLQAARAGLKERFGICHAVLQVETGAIPCDSDSDA